MTSAPYAPASAAPAPASGGHPVRRSRLLATRFTWFAAAFVVACLVMQMIPAFQSPDETLHLLRADMIAHGQPVLVREEPDSPGSTGGQVDGRFLQFALWAQKLIGPQRDRSIQPEAFMREADKHDWLDQEAFVHAAGTGYYAPLIYAPHALGLKLSRALDATLGHSYKMTRILVTLVVFGVAFWAWQIWRPSLPVLALLLMPMTLFQVVSPTIDGLCFALALLVLSLFLLQWHAPGRVTPWHRGAFCLAIFMLVTSRTNLLPLLLLPWLLAARHRAWRQVPAAIALVAASVGWTLYGLLTTYDDRVQRAFTSSQIIGFYLQDPLQLLGLVGKTLAHPDQGYLILYTFIGHLGWADAPIPRYAMLAIVGGLALAAALSVGGTRFERRDALLRGALVCMGLGSALLAFAALAVTWNPYPTDLIRGIHGRYFIIPAMFAAAALGSVKAGPEDPAAPARAAPWAHGFTLAYAAFCLFALVVTLQDRYGMDPFQGLLQGLFRALGSPLLHRVVDF